MKRVIYIAFFTIVFGCEKIVVLDVNQTTPQIVIEGLLTNIDTIHYIKVSETIQFYETELIPITDAVITVRSGNNQYTYSHNPSSIASLEGFYFSDLPYSAIIGKSYTLYVNVAGVDYIAEDTMKSITTIDSLSFRLAPAPNEKEIEEKKIYQVLLYAKEPQETEDYYQLLFFRNKAFTSVYNEIYVFSDEAIKTKLDGIPSRVLFREGELATVKMYSLTRKQFIFYSDLSSLLTNDGGMFSPPPSNPRNNFSNNALGLWQVSAVSKSSIIIEP